MFIEVMLNDEITRMRTILICRQDSPGTMLIRPDFSSKNTAMTPQVRDQTMMRLALDQAHNAAILGEVPVGAVLVRGGKVIATGFNHPGTWRRSDGGREQPKISIQILT